MYGIVNQAIQGLVIEKFGQEIWTKILDQSQVEVRDFLSNEPYSDDITYSLAGTAAEVLGISLGDVLIAFGEYWVLKTGLEKYGTLMQSGGENLKEFLTNLPSFHSRVMLMYPKLTPPEFDISDIQEESLIVHYYSQRQGLEPFVVGLLQGLGKMYDVEVDIEHTQTRTSGHDHDEFLVKW